MIVTVDVVIFTIDNNKVKVLLQKRNKEPALGKYALPGGYVHEDTEANTLDTVHRVLKDKLGLNPPYVEQYRAWSSKDRDSRGWSMTDIYFTIVPRAYLEPMPADSALFDLTELPADMPMLHDKFVLGAYQRVKNTVMYSSLPAHFFDKPFTIFALQKVYELFKGETINKVTFRRYMDELGAIEPTGEKDRSRACAPADLYQLKPEYVSSLSKLDRGV